MIKSTDRVDGIYNEQRIKQPNTLEKDPYFTKQYRSVYLADHLAQ